MVGTADTIELAVALVAGLTVAVGTMVVVGIIVVVGLVVVVVVAVTVVVGFTLPSLLVQPVKIAANATITSIAIINLFIRFASFGFYFLHKEAQL